MARSGRPRAARSRLKPQHHGAEAEGDRPDPPVSGEHRVDDAAEEQDHRQDPERHRTVRAAPPGSSDLSARTRFMARILRRPPDAR